jgi:hypothetical protein
MLYWASFNHSWVLSYLLWMFSHKCYRQNIWASVFTYQNLFLAKWKCAILHISNRWYLKSHHYLTKIRNTLLYLAIVVFDFSVKLFKHKAPKTSTYGSNIVPDYVLTTLGIRYMTKFFCACRNNQYCCSWSTFD